MEYSPDSMKSVLKLVHPTSFFNEMFNSVEVDIFAGFKALGVVQDEVCICLVRKCLIDIGLPWFAVRYLLDGAIDFNNQSKGSSDRPYRSVVHAEDFIDQ
jgi:hypothetical protein